MKKIILSLAFAFTVGLGSVGTYAAVRCGDTNAKCHDEKTKKNDKACNKDKKACCNSKSVCNKNVTAAPKACNMNKAPKTTVAPKTETPPTKPEKKAE